MTRTFVFLVAIILAAALAAPARQPGSQQDNLEVQLKALVKDWAQASDQRQWFQTNLSRLNPQLADKAHEVANSLLPDQQLKSAQLLFLFSALTYLELGDRGNALTNFIDSLQVQFMMADTPEQYQKVIDQALNTSRNAESIDRRDSQFEALVIAADSAYFASKNEKGLEAEKPIKNTLTQCVAALKTIRYASNRVYIERFVSLLSAAIEGATSVPFVETEASQSEVDALLKQVAAGAEQSIPTDFQFTERQIGSPAKSIETARILAEVSYRYGSASSASARLMVAAQRARDQNDTDTWLRLISARYSGERRAGMPEVFLAKLREEAWSSSQQLREGFRSRAGRIWIAYRTDLFYADMLTDQLKAAATSPDKTFAAAEILKARTLLDAIASPISTTLPANTDQLQNNVLGFNAPTYGVNDMFMGEMRLVSQLSPFESIAEEDLDKRLQALSQLEQAYQQVNLGFTASAATAQLRDIQEAMQSREAILEFAMPFHPLDPAHDLWALFISKDGFRAVQAPLEILGPSTAGFIGRLSVDGQAPVDASPLDNLIVETRAAIRKSDEKHAKAYLQGLYTLLIKPLTDNGVKLEDYDRITIVPHGMLHYVPFPALIDERGNFLISKTALTIAPSASVWLALLKRGGLAQHFVGFANPSVGNGAPDLPYADQEISGIAQELTSANPVVFKGGDATADRVVQEARTADLLHIATHGEFPDDKAMDNHAVLLAKGKANGGTLSASAVRQIDLRHNRLTVLSVCNGGLYRMGPADSPFGLIPAFIEAGSQNVMGTLWPLDDQFGRDFMIEYYGHLLQDGPAKAYQKAALKFVAQDEFIRHWAAYVLVGPGRPFTSGVK
jgi:CHAT domain-containing protein